MRPPLPPAPAADPQARGRELLAADLRSADLHKADPQARGRELLAEGRLEEAVAALSEAVRRTPKAPTAWNARGYAYLRLRRFKEAIADFEKALALDPSYANARHNLEVARRTAAGR
jgi:Flp pilus assembly protein TadD